MSWRCSGADNLELIRNLVVIVLSKVRRLRMHGSRGSKALRSEESLQARNH